jgi:hypothetical protein
MLRVWSPFLYDASHPLATHYQTCLQAALSASIGGWTRTTSEPIPMHLQPV